MHHSYDYETFWHHSYDYETVRHHSYDYETLCLQTLMTSTQNIPNEALCRLNQITVLQLLKIAIGELSCAPVL